MVWAKVDLPQKNIFSGTPIYVREETETTYTGSFYPSYNPTGRSGKIDITVEKSDCYMKYNLLGNMPTDIQIQELAREYFQAIYTDGVDVTHTKEKFADGVKWLRAALMGESFHPFKR